MNLDAIDRLVAEKVMKWKPCDKWRVAQYTEALYEKLQEYGLDMDDLA